jgi:hypothetical protein
VYLYGGRRYFLLEYEDASSLIRLWIAVESELLAKAQVIAKSVHSSREGMSSEVDYTFSGYGLKFQIIPPPSWAFMPAGWKFFIGKTPI